MPSPAAASVASAPEQITRSQASGTPASAPASTQYTVQRGDSLYTIARTHGVSITELRTWNGLGSDRIYPGQKLNLQLAPGQAMTTYTVRRGDNLTSIARRFGVTVDELCAWNGISRRSTLYPGARLSIRAAAAGR